MFLGMQPEIERVLYEMLGGGDAGQDNYVKFTTTAKNMGDEDGKDDNNGANDFGYGGNDDEG